MMWRLGNVSFESNWHQQDELVAALRLHLQKEQAYVEYLKAAVQFGATGPDKENQEPPSGADWQTAPLKATNQHPPPPTGANFELLRQCFQGCHLRYAPSSDQEHPVVGPSLWNDGILSKLIWLLSLLLLLLLFLKILKWDSVFIDFGWLRKI